MAPFNAWLVIEVVSFYLYIVEVIIYVSSHQIRQEYRREIISDIRKSITDFIVYSQDQLNWFTFDFQLLMIPPIFIAVVALSGFVKSMNLDLNSDYSRTLLILWLMHFLSFLINRRSFNRTFFDNSQIDDFKRLEK